MTAGFGLINGLMNKRLMMKKQYISWGKGSSFNFGTMPEYNVRLERSKGPDGWSFLVSDNKITYLHVDNRTFNTKEELDCCIISWLKEKHHEKL